MSGACGLVIDGLAGNLGRLAARTSVTFVLPQMANPHKRGPRRRFSPSRGQTEPAPARKGHNPPGRDAHRALKIPHIWILAMRGAS